MLDIQSRFKALVDKEQQLKNEKAVNESKLGMYKDEMKKIEDNLFSQLEVSTIEEAISKVKALEEQVNLKVQAVEEGLNRYESELSGVNTVAESGLDQV